MPQVEMQDAQDMAVEITESLPAEMCIHTALVALSLVTSSVIENADTADRDDLIEVFCSILRKGTRTSH